MRGLVVGDDKCFLNFIPRYLERELLSYDELEYIEESDSVVAKEARIIKRSVGRILKIIGSFRKKTSGR